jgi:hypothetical protein
MQKPTTVGQRKPCPISYFNPVDTLVKVVLRFEPRVVTARMIAIEMPAAMSPYSMAVAAVSSRRKCIINLPMGSLAAVVVVCGASFIGVSLFYW